MGVLWKYPTVDRVVDVPQDVEPADMQVVDPCNVPMHESRLRVKYNLTHLL